MQGGLAAPDAVCYWRWVKGHLQVEKMAVESAPSVGDTHSSMFTPWLERHRPRVLEDIVGNSDTIERLKIIAQEGNLMNMLFAGPPGVGKTSAVHAMCLQLFRAHGEAQGMTEKEIVALKKRAVLELNASDERCVASRRWHGMLCL